VEDFMNKYWGHALLGAIVFLFCISVTAVCFAGPKAPEGYRNVKLGMTKPQIIDILKKEPGNDSFEEMGDEIGEIIRNDNLFRFAIYKFDSQGQLVEISLQMREILGRDKVLELFNAQHGLSIEPSKKFVESNRTVEVQDNKIVIKFASNNRSRSAKSNQ
jgi:hypothetical protein